ncbi:LysR family transcriptional regulator [Bradyrhizobium prioriisuperbiae]|uniref:LysR family transcriptional regulator n=1 Tax=Bradyrhizobium prioriisuperbiae TaxID=2854389 RepID=UPI0028EAFA33|nr:LysR family transcriptional regulator [Bradyrhizobium prioritasuperba]
MFSSTLGSPQIAKSDTANATREIRYNWDDVIFFLEVARARNLVRAGQKLKVDHTTVSRRVRELERSLNISLFKRSKAGFSLTEAGMRLLQFAEGMENNANAIVETVVGTADAAGAVRLASMEGIGSMYLTTCLTEFQRTYPSIQLELITDTRLLDMTRREADVFVSFFRPKGRRLSVKKIGEFKIFLYAATSYLKKHRAPTELKELEAHSFIDFIDEHIHIKENRWLSDILRPPHVVFRSTSLVSQYMAACSGAGIAMLPSFVAAQNPDLVPILPSYFSIRDIWMSVHEDMLHIGRIKAVMTFLEKRVAADAVYLKSVGSRAQRIS